MSKNFWKKARRLIISIILCKKLHNSGFQLLKTEKGAVVHSTLGFWGIRPPQGLNEV